MLKVAFVIAFILMFSTCTVYMVTKIHEVKSQRDRLQGIVYCLSDLIGNNGLYYYYVNDREYLGRAFENITNAPIEIKMLDGLEVSWTELPMLASGSKRIFIFYPLNASPESICVRTGANSVFSVIYNENTGRYITARRVHLQENAIVKIVSSVPAEMVSLGKE